MDYSQPAFIQSYTCPLILLCSNDSPSHLHHQDQLYHCDFCLSDVKEPSNNKATTGAFLKYINMPLFFSYVEVSKGSSRGTQLFRVLYSRRKF